MPVAGIGNKASIDTACEVPVTSAEKQAGGIPVRFNQRLVSQTLSNSPAVAPGNSLIKTEDINKLQKRTAASSSQWLNELSPAQKRICSASEHNDSLLKAGEALGPLSLDNNSRHARSFNELVRRIKHPHQSKILEKLQSVTKEQIGIIIDCLWSPTDLTGQYLTFFSSEDFPYAVLQAFREEAISLHAFSTLVTLYGIYQENITFNPSFAIHHQKLFDEYGQPLQEAWQKIEATISETDSRKGVFQYDVPNCIRHMQACLKSASPLEAGFWYYTTATPRKSCTIAWQVMNYGKCCVFSPDQQGEMVPSLTMRQTFVDVAYGEEAHRINPVIGDSTPLDIRNGGLARYRDYQLPFPGLSLPEVADGCKSPDISGFNLHDYYHLLRSSALPNKFVDLYIAMGDKMGWLQKEYDKKIGSLKKLCRKKLEQTEIRLTGLASKKKQVEISKIEQEMTLIHKLILSLRMNRKGLGELKCAFYDLEMCVVNLDNYEPIPGVDKEWSFHLQNIYQRLNMSESHQHINGMTAELAGRILIPMIPGSDDLPRETYANLVSFFHRGMGLRPGFRITGSDGKIIESIRPKFEHYPHFEDFDRTLRFINCINTGDISATLPYVVGQRL